MPSCCGGWMGFMGAWMALVLLTFVAFVVVGIVLMIRGWSSQGIGSQRREGDREPLHILAERYARGEIDREEFEERRRALRS